MFIDIRDFTPTPKPTPPRTPSPASTRCSEIVVPAVVEAGDVNKFLGDGALVFGRLTTTPIADAAVRDRKPGDRPPVAARLARSFCIGIGINTGW